MAHGEYGMRRDVWIPVISGGVLAVTLALLPPERHVGRLLVPIFIHGALVRTGVLLFAVGVPAALAALILETPWAWNWTRGLQVTAWVAWLVGFVVSFYPSHVTWGTPIAWSEPRTQMVVRVLVVTLLAFGVARWLDEPKITAGVSILVGVAVPLLVWHTGVIRHPVDPIGTSPSIRFQIAYMVTVGCMVIIGVWGTYRLAGLQK